MKIFAILARSQNNFIGKNSSLPWIDDLNTKWDLANFKEATSENIVFMGFNTYKTFEKPLPNRINVVEIRKNSLKEDELKDGFIFVSSLEEFLQENSQKFESEWENKNIFIIGGAKILQKYISKIETLILTTFFNEYEGDVKFPKEILNKFSKIEIKKEFSNGKIEIYS